jgi:hypothetical protein
MSFLVSGFTNGANNGTFVCTASSTTTITLANTAGVSESAAASMISAGAVYWDEQNGSKVLLFPKSPGAGQTHFQAVAGILYMGDGVDTRKYTPLNTNLPPGGSVSIWNWGIVAPAKQPNVTSVASGAASTIWQANTFFTTMGLTVDTFGQVWQLIGVNADGTNTANAVFGTAGNGNPSWNQTLYGTTTEGSGTPIVWKNLGVIGTWQARTDYGDAGVAGTAAPVAIFDPTSQSVYVNFHSAGALSPSGGVKPPFNGVVGSSFNDGTCHWFFLGSVSAAQPLQKWKPSTAYVNWYANGTTDLTGVNSAIEPFLLPPPPDQPIYLQVPTNNGTSGASYAPFLNNSAAGTQTDDAQLLWLSLGSGTWQASTNYIQWQAQGTPFGVVNDGTNMQVCVVSGQSGVLIPGTADSLTAANNASGGNTTYTGTFPIPFTAGKPVTITGFLTAANNGTTFTVVSCNSTTLVVNNPNGVAETHSGTATYNPWGTVYGQTTQDGTTTWVCVGPQTTWVAGTSTTGIWNLPLAGFQPPQSSQAYGGSTVNSNTALVETVISSGKSGTVQPTWGAVHTNTTDNGITWFAESVVVANSLSWQTGLAYAYSFKARAFDDFYSPAPLGGGNIPPGSVVGALGFPTGSATNAVSTASPAFIITGGNVGAVNTVTGTGSTDPQVDTIIIWRSADGGGSAQMFELTEIPSPKPIGGVAQPWSFQDFLPDTATNKFPGLNTQIPAPIDEVNDPPPVTFLPMAYNFQRIWGADGEAVPFSGGPDTKVGNPDECFLPSDNLPFLAPVTRIVKTPQGLVTFLTDGVEVIAGGPLTASFFSVTWAPGIGLTSFNALDILAGEIYFFSSDNQFRIMTPSLNIVNAGFALGDQFANQPSSGVSDATWDASKVYVASHQSGVDNCIFVADGSTGWYRLNPHQAGALPSTEPVWSPFAAITNGTKMVQSVEVTPGIKKLLVGGTIPNQPILKRDLSIFTDNGSQYDAFFVMGSISLCHPGQLALLKFVEFDMSGQNFQPQISYLLNEISGTFTAFTALPVFDPPTIYGGRNVVPNSYSPIRYYFLSNASLARCRHLQLRVDFGMTSNGDELFSATIFGRLMVEV